MNVNPVHKNHKPTDESVGINANNLRWLKVWKRV